MLQHKITLRGTREGCQLMEKEARYDVLLNGVKVGQLSFNMKGYCGTLPLPNGRKLVMPEAGIGTYRKMAARINRGEVS